MSRMILWALYRTADGKLTERSKHYAGTTFLAAARTARQASDVANKEIMWNPYRPERAGLVSITRSDREACWQRLFCGCLINASGAFVELYEDDSLADVQTAIAHHVCLSELAA